jgi:hydrogenase nickel incorporation protein HypA/HybF
MHEASLVKSLLRQVEEIRAEQDGLSVEEIRIEIGPLAGVEPMLVRSAFLQLASDCNMGEARLMIDEVSLSARCSSCGLVVVALARIACPICGSLAVSIVSGNEMRLQSVTIRQAEKMEATQ